VYDGKDGHVRADAERERQDRGRGEARLVPEQPQGVPDVVEKHGEDLRRREAPAFQEEQERGGGRAPAGPRAIDVQIEQRRLEQLAPHVGRQQARERSREAGPTHRTSLI
jgi:hypothetical protein